MNVSQLSVDLEAEPRRVVLIKSDDHWCFRWYPGDERLILQRLSALAEDPLSSIDWVDAALVSHHLGRQMTSSEAGPPAPPT